MTNWVSHQRFEGANRIATADQSFSGSVNGSMPKNATRRPPVVASRMDTRASTLSFYERICNTEHEDTFRILKGYSGTILQICFIYLVTCVLCFDILTSRT